MLCLCGLFLTGEGFTGDFGSLLPLLDRIIVHLRLEDIRCLRLTAKCFRMHTVVLNVQSTVRYPMQVSMADFQAGLAFLNRLPKLRGLSLKAPWTLVGLGQLSQLTALDISSCQEVLDLYPLTCLPLLQELVLEDCQAEHLGNISELGAVTALTMDQQAVQQQVSKLTNLASLTLYSESNMTNVSAWVSLKGITSLVDNALGKTCWHLLPRLDLLDISTCPGTLSNFVPTRLRGLALHTGSASEGVVLDSLAPLSALPILKHLDLTGDLILPLPALTALTMLTIEFRRVSDSLPDLSTAPLLQMLELWLVGQLVLPDLACLSRLSTIYFNNDRGGPLLKEVTRVMQHRFQYVNVRRSLSLAVAVDRK